MAEVIKKADLAEAQAIDFVGRFGFKVNKLVETLGITNKIPMKVGDKIATYKFNLTEADGAAANGVVAEGTDIPLTHVGREVDKEYPIAFKKYRKAVTIEAVQKYGYDLAVKKTDKEVLNKVQKDIREAFFTMLATSPTADTATGLQEAFGKAWGKVNNIFDSDEQVVVFVNPEDAGDYLGTANISNGESVGFGLTLLQGFTNIKAFTLNGVPKGKVYATAVGNLNLAYLDAKGEVSKMFVNKPVFTDETGLIGLVRDDNTTNLTNQSSIFTGIQLFPEIPAGVIEYTLNV